MRDPTNRGDNDGGDRHFRIGFGLDPLFNRIRNKWVRRIAVIVVVAVVFGLFGWGIGKALAMCSPDGSTACPPAKYAAQHYRHNKMGHDHFAFSMFKNPRQARHMALRRIRHKINATAAQGPSKVATLATSMTPHEWLRTLTGPRADCIGNGSYAPYSTGFNVCHYAANGGGNTLQGVQSVGALVFCGGGVFIAWWTAGASLLVTGWGGAACLWGAWMALDPG